ncbi:hypothetical protein C8R47DRAFT_1138955 [Mycena vitilis]|nr:hypothetical protein C8R47DRAFT_1138955 [Mycena vitilis]
MYQPLPREPPSVVPKEGETGDLDEPDSPKRVSRLQYLPLLLCILCTVLNASLTLAYSGTNSAHTPPITHKNIHHLRRPSQYIRFDEIHRPVPPVPQQFNNYPIVLTQVDAADPGRAFPQDPVAYMSPIGTVVPEDRPVLITSTISTIVQFRTIDWGMEDCELHLALPAVKHWDIGSSVVLHQLNQTYPLDLATLTYRSRPPRVATMASIRLAPSAGTTWQHQFACATDEILTFELACSPTKEGSDCSVEWWQKFHASEPGVYLTQHATA